MPKLAITSKAQHWRQYAEAAANGAFGQKRLTGTGNHTPPSGYLYYAVLARTSAAEAGASCTVPSYIAGDAIANGDPVETAAPVVIGPHDQLQFDTNADVVYAYLIPAP